MTPLLASPFAQALAHALVHFVWQGALIGLAAVALLRGLGLGASARYRLGMVLLVSMLAAPAATTWFLLDEPALGTSLTDGRPFAAAGLPPAMSPAEPPATAVDVRSASDPWATLEAIASRINPLVVLKFWLIGLTIGSARLAIGWLAAHRLARRRTHATAPAIHQAVNRVAGRLALDVAVRVLESAAVAVPVVIGWISPVVILPAAALGGLTPAQLEALIAHELAHVARRDYLLNLLQSVVETILFYHPAVWWLSAEVRAAREDCCDDAAVAVCDRLVYATALTDLAGMTARPRLALAASDGSLVRRVRRILGQPVVRSNARSIGTPLVLLALTAAGLTAATSAPSRAPQVVAATSQAATVSVAPVAVPAVVAAPVPVPAPTPVPAAAVAARPRPAAAPVDIVPLVRPPQTPQPTAQTTDWRTEKLDMLALLLARAQQHLDNVRQQIWIGTMAGIDLTPVADTLDRVRAASDRYSRASAAEPPRSGSDAALVRAKFADAVRQLDDEERRFDVGVSNTYQLDQATLAALAVLTAAPPAGAPVLATTRSPEAPSPAALRDRIMREGATLSDDAMISMLEDTAKIASDADRADVLLAIARQVALTPDMVTLYVAAAKAIQSDAERARVFNQPVRLR